MKRFITTLVITLHLSPIGVLDMDITDATNRVMLATVLWRECRGETFNAKVAVAYSILERVAHPGWWGRDLISVITKPWQYSSFTDPRDPQLIKWPQLTDTSYKECWDAATKAMDKTASNPAPKANSYYDLSIPPPAWATPDTFITKLGRLKFHRVPSPPPRTDT